MISISPLTSFSNQHSTMFGGKGSSLSELANAGILVPSGFVILTSVFDHFIKSTSLSQKISNELNDIDYSNIHDVRRVSLNIQEAMTRKEIPKDVKEEILRAFDELNSEFVAVRSSATVEDSCDGAWAGQLDSFLNVREDDLLSEVRKCWASLYTPRAICYRFEKGLEDTDVSVAVIVQKMVKSKMSGVAFSVQPVTEDSEKMVIEACFGLGEALVSGLVTPDLYIISKKDLYILDKNVAKQTKKIVRANGGGNKWIETQKEEVVLQVLTDEQINTLSKLVVEIEIHHGVPCDVEWAIDDAGEMYILQSRPITTGGNRKIYDNSNIAESYAGVTTPLTYSFARYVYQEVYKHFCRTMGASTLTIRENDDMFKNMVTFIGYRMYYDLINWHHMISFFPGYQFSREFMEKMMGVEKVYKKKKTAPPTTIRKYFIEMPRLVIQGVKISFSFMFLGLRMRRFNKHFDQYYEKDRNIDIKNKDLRELKEFYDRLDEELVRRWRVPIVNDFAVMVSAGLADKLYRVWVGSDDAYTHMRNSNKKSLVSLEPGLYILEILRSMQNDDDILKMFDKSMNENEILHTLKNEFSSHATSIKVFSYLEKFGGRVPNELKLESETFSEDPITFIRMLKSYRRTNKTDVASVNKINNRSGTSVKENLKSLSVSKRSLLLFLFSWAGNSIRRREESRFRRGQAFDMVRKIFLAAGELFSKEGHISEPRDIFFLTVEEIFEKDNIELRLEYKDIIEKRKNEYAIFSNIEMPRRIETNQSIKGIEDQILNGQEKIKNKVSSESRGTVTSKGKVGGILTGVAVTLKEFDPNVDFSDKILVTKHTDPGWTVIFPLLRGVIIERGGMLSHASIVAREFNIPCIVGLERATSIIKSGQKISMNVESGEVCID